MSDGLNNDRENYNVLKDELYSLKDQVKDLQHIMIGVDGKNGIRGTLRTVQQDYKTVNERLTRVEIRIATYIGIGVAVVWGLGKFV